MFTTSASVSAVPHIKQGRTRALWAAGGALAAALVWIVEVPLLGIHLNFRFGDRKSTRLNSSHKTVSRMPSSA